MPADAPPTDPVDYIARTRERYEALGFAPYRWVQDASQPGWAPLAKPLHECKVGLIGSGGVYVVGQEAYHYCDDVSYRLIPTNTASSDLRITHFAYDVRDARVDPNCVLPLWPLRRLAEQGHIGSVADEAFSFVGGIYSARRCRDELAPQLVARIIEQGCDIALLVPV